MSTGNASDASSYAGVGVPVRVLLLLVDVYRAVLSPLAGGFCAYEPTCSVYAQKALRRHGAGRGLILAGRRLLRCRPFCRGGFDPVP